MIARLTVARGATTEYPLAERVKGGWQNGVTFYPDAEVTKVTELHVSREHGHAAEALATLGRIRGVDEVTNQLTLALDAQVHATLALVEQQRIANLIALASLPKVDGFENEVYEASTEALMEGLLDSETVAAVPGYGPAGIDQHVFIRPAIKGALGLS